MCLWHQAYKEERYHFPKETRTPKEEKDLDKFVNQTLKNGLYRSIQKKIDSLKQTGLRTEGEIRIQLNRILIEEEREFL